ncbi:MAG: histone deacetylase family protein [Pseudomonadota bacterium]
MAAALYSHESSEAHVTPPGHPERVARLDAVREALAPFQSLDRRTCPPGDEADILRAHDAGHLAAIKAASPERDYISLDADTHMAPGSLEAAMFAVGGITAAVDAVVSGEVGNACVTCRPPGHHAKRARPMGFCLFGNAAIGALRALDVHGLARVAVVDFDVHHGNGTQDILWDEPRAFFGSSHQMPLYPGSGAAQETGANGNVVNAPLPPMSGALEMRAAWSNRILPDLRAFAPELVIISAGFDAAAEDPLANLNWSAEDFAWVTNAILDVADEVADGRVVSTLEGGYDLGALGRGMAAHVKELMERGG